jgi:biotin carboxyl carrier protein
VAAVSISIALDGREPHDVQVARSGEAATVWIDGTAYPALLTREGAAAELEIDGRREQVWCVVDRDDVFVHAFGRSWTLHIADPVEQSLRASQPTDAAVAPMPGVLVALSVADGDDVVAGQTLAVIESMKMQTDIRAPRDGRVDRVLVAVGDTFGQGAPLIALEKTEEQE